MAKIGYLEGTNPEVLDQLAIRGHRLFPLGDGGDNHGKSLALLSVFDAIDLIITHYHKLKRTSRLHYSSFGSLLESLRRSDTQVVLVAPVEITAQVRSELEAEGVEDAVKLVLPEKLTGEVITLLEGEIPEG